MSSGKAPRWLTQAFVVGVDERQPPGGIRLRPPYPGAYPACELARHDERRRRCSGRIERFHYVNRQRVETAMKQQLRGASIAEPCPYCAGSGTTDDVEPECCGNTTSSGECRGECVVPRQVEVACASCTAGVIPVPMLPADSAELVHLAAWDSRNADYGCEGHHRRFDSHLTPALTIPYADLPARVVHFAFEFGIDGELRRFPSEI